MPRRAPTNPYQPLPAPTKDGRLSPATVKALGQLRRRRPADRDLIAVAVALGRDLAEETGADLDATVWQAVREALAELRSDRDALIRLAVRHRFTRHRLATIFGLSKSRIAAIATFQYRTEPAPADESLA